MRFDRLRLTGFKSFVDPTDLVIADGLTGVVGPNGCGKSNLLEALRWVMGETRPTAMRGGGMEDVIFAGAASRPARGFAEVTLLVDNAERLAPAAFNESDQIEVTRRITRDAGSAYKLNGKDVRARDVAMLFADASTGAHSPALVRQGQISELINAKPQKRRRVLEEAAGISGLYQRRHEAELKLNATSANLARVDDVVENLAAQLATLARQARQAARYREVSEALEVAESALLARRFREAEDALEAAEGSLREAVLAASAAERAARAADQARETADAALPPLREEAAVAQAVLNRAEAARETLDEKVRRAEQAIGGIEGRLRQIAKDAERESALDADARETLRALEAEAADLAERGADEPARIAVAKEAASAAAAGLAAREEALGEATERLARLQARHGAAERLEGEAQGRLARAEAEMERADRAADAARAALAEAEREAASGAADRAQAEAAAEAAEAALVAAEAAREAAQEREGAARTARAEAEGAATALRAEVSALEKLLARDGGGGTALLDRVRVDEGWEAALGAAFGDDLSAGEDAADGGGWRALPDRDAGVPEGAEALAAHVEAPAVLRRALSGIGVVEGDRAAAMQAGLAPGQALVSKDGDLWRWDGYRVPAEAAPSAAALRLRQVNRLQSLRRDLEETEASLAGARSAHETLGRELEAARAADAEARAARRDADRDRAEAARRADRAESAQVLAAGRLETAGLARGRHEAERDEAAAALSEAKAARMALDPLDGARTAQVEARAATEAARAEAATLRAAADGMAREAEARAARAAAVEKDRRTWADRLASAGGRVAELEARRAKAEADLAEARSRPAALEREGVALSDTLDRARARVAAATDGLAEGERAAREAAVAARDAERAAGEAREVRARAETRREAAADAVGAAAERIREAYALEPPALLSRIEGDLPPAERLETDIARLRRQRDGLGSVNLRAEEDRAAVAEEHDTLVAEKADLEAAVAELRAGIAALNKEGRQRLLDAFEGVNRGFGDLFKHLFGGGEARLELVESDDPLEAGLEILAQPPGKRLTHLGLLSGGEQTLTALALIFAVFLANPAPICVLDEVDAPLDDANVGRFCDMLDEMTQRADTRFLVITHHAVTMARMDRLFGVTMAEQGVSQLVSVDLRAAESLVA
ncbi:AAA family ATPase [Jannaschia sp. Os4]|uniref:chromosome segregation SMC family protein n=1 Tax=Jannaschia sp. Os4 TaxID=2807617 RepID=UPI001939B44A|nr:AAA family ATPase [Jannaschia sp. Os4]MBM2574713.1 AAA family ATPase [Jannaschia sp. Os4]